MTKFSEVLDELGRARVDSHALLRAIQANVHNIEEQLRISVELDKRLQPLGDDLVDSRLDEQADRATETIASLPSSQPDDKAPWRALERVRKGICARELHVRKGCEPKEAARLLEWNDAINAAVNIVTAEQRRVADAPLRIWPEGCDRP
jgi:hypothetical protein